MEHSVEREARRKPAAARSPAWLQRQAGGSVGRLGWLGVWSAIFLGLTLLVHERLLTRPDEAVLQLVALLRPASLTEVMNWIFRFGFAQVNAVLALAWAGFLLARRRSLLAAIPPLILFVAIGVQAGFRLVVDQPAPGSAYALNRRFAAQPVGYALDRADAVARETFVAATATLKAPAATPTPAAGERGSFPSGHATRALFLALLMQHELRRSSTVQRWLRHRLPRLALIVLAGLVGYSAMYYGYHWPSDVLGGYLLAMALYQLAIWLPDRLAGRDRRTQAAGFSPIGPAT